jgi:hypothetical protein
MSPLASTWLAHCLAAAPEASVGCLAFGCFSDDDYSIPLTSSAGTEWLRQRLTRFATVLVMVELGAAALLREVSTNSELTGVESCASSKGRLGKRALSIRYLRREMKMGHPWYLFVSLYFVDKRRRRAGK